MSEAVLKQEVELFYARQMRHMDSGEASRWAATFTLDGVFTANAHPEPQRGRAEIEQKAAAVHQLLTEQGLTRRHWLGMVDAIDRGDGTISAQSYALVIETPLGGQATTKISCTCEDILVRDGDSFLVRHRHVRRDDLGAE